MHESLATSMYVIIEALAMMSDTTRNTVSAPNLIIPLFLEHAALSNLPEQIPLISASEMHFHFKKDLSTDPISYFLCLRF